MLVSRGERNRYAKTAAKAKQILDSLKIRLMDPRWSRRTLVDRNPMTWMLQVNGIIVDARDLPRDLQEEAFRLGLIPYIPEQKANDAWRGTTPKRSRRCRFSPSPSAAACAGGYGLAYLLTSLLQQEAQTAGTW